MDMFECVVLLPKACSVQEIDVSKIIGVVSYVPPNIAFFVLIRQWIVSIILEVQTNNVKRDTDR